VVPLKAPVVVLRVKIAASEALATYTFLPSAEMQRPTGEEAAAIEVVPLKAPVLVLRVKIETVPAPPLDA